MTTEPTYSGLWGETKFPQETINRLREQAAKDEKRALDRIWNVNPAGTT